MASRVEISFECMPLREVARVDVPMDASPAYERFVICVKKAIETHGRHNTYYLSRGHCSFFVTNDPNIGQISFQFSGTVFTDEHDIRCVGIDLQAEFAGETCDWIVQNVIDWYQQSVSHAVKAEFDRYIASGDLSKAQELASQRMSEANDAGGFVGMYL